MAINLFTLLSKEEITDWLGEGCECIGDALFIPAARLMTVLDKIKTAKDRGLPYLLDITAVDRGERFTVVYQLYSIERGESGCVHVELEKQQPSVSSVTALWPGADWMEREVFDLMGIIFEGHPCLERILLDEDYQGHPLRKDFQMPTVNEQR